MKNFVNKLVNKSPAGSFSTLLLRILSLNRPLKLHRTLIWTLILAPTPDLYSKYPKSSVVRITKAIKLRRLSKESCKSKSRISLNAELKLNSNINQDSLFRHYRLDLLLRCGDVESNPGPDPGPGLEAIKKPKPSIQAITYNVRGLGDRKKVRHLINHCHKLCQKATDSIFMFQETYVEKLSLLDYIWRGDYQLTSGTGNSLGCITLLSAPYKILHCVTLGERGHILVLTKGDVNNAELIAANIYAPNGLQNDKLDFFESLVQELLQLQTDYNCDKVIVGGDFNLVFNECEVKNRAFTNPEKRMAQAVEQMLVTAELTDAWKVSPNKSFTWTVNRNGRQLYSALDRFLFSKDKLSLVDTEVDWSLSLSDHAMLKTIFSDPVSIRNPCNFIPRLDSRILDDKETCALLNQEFDNLMDGASPGWNPHVTLEFCKMAIRTAVYTATGKIKASIRDEEATVNEDINTVINELSLLPEGSVRAQLLIHKLDDLRNIKRQLVDKIGTRIERRTMKKWHNEGELSNKYFFNLLNRKSNDTVTSILIDGEPSSDPKKIESEIRNFYRNLYESVPQELDINENLFRNIDSVDTATEDLLVRPLTIDELTATLRSCLDSAPGPDGIPYSFLKYFWNKVGPILLNAWNYSLLTHELPPSHKLSYLRLIPKAGKDSRVIGNLRPITLSNTDHKLITKTYARKLTTLVSPNISQEQTAYIPNRLINDNIRSMLMTVDLANSDPTIDGVVVSLDAKKAFDSVDHRYICKCLEAFGFRRFIPIFNVLYKDLRSNIILNGGVIGGYNILKGVKQGDALSCILFVMCIEPVLRNIKNNAQIRNIISNKLTLDIPKAYGYADDVNVITRACERDIQEIFNEYESFSNSSGLILNAEKTEILRFRHRRPQKRTFNVSYMGRIYPIETRDGIKVNGILFFQDPRIREERNREKVIEAMQKHLACWSRRHLTLLGKILIIKTFAVSQAIFLMQSLMLQDKSLKAINNLLYKFLWNKNFFGAKAPDRIQRKIMVTPVKDGGFGMMDIELLNKSLTLRAIGRMVSSEHPMFKQLWQRLKYKCFFNVSTNLEVDLKLKEGLKLLNIVRRGTLNWPIERVLQNVNLCSILGTTKLADVLTNPGRISMAVFQLLRRNRNFTISDLTLADLATIERFLLYPGLSQIIRQLLLTNVWGQVVAVAETKILYPTNNYELTRLPSLSSRNFRELVVNEAEQMICVYKCGMILTPGELLNWTRRIKQLTSTRHRCAILRVAHGDVYTNKRLARFGLINNSKCSNCDRDSEDLAHRIMECRQAKRAWTLIESKIEELGLQPLDPNNLTFEDVLGAGQGENPHKIALTIRTELLSKLMTRGGTSYCPDSLAKACIKTIYTVENLDPTLRIRLNEIVNSLTR